MPKQLTVKKILNLGSLIILFVIIFSYGIWRSRDLLFGINLSVSGVSDMMTTTEQNLNLSGISKHAVKIEINDQDVPVSQDGTWAYVVALQKGYGIIKVTAEDKFKKEVTKIFHVYYNAPEEKPVEVIPPPETKPAETTIEKPAEKVRK